MLRRIVSEILLMLLLTGMLTSAFESVVGIGDTTSTGSFATPYPSSASSELEETQWNRTYGGANDDYARSIVQTMDGGFALAGYTNSYGAGGYDFWLVKTDAVGNVQWNQTYGTPGDDWAYSVIQTSDGGYALAGHSYYGGFHGLLVKTDEFGNMLWSKTYGGPYPGGASLLYSAVQTSDGGYAMAGFAYTGAGPYDFWLVKTDASGNVQWSNTYGDAGNDIAYSVIQTNDGGYALAGYTTSYGEGKADFWLVKTDANGILEGWETYGGAGDDIAYSVIQTADGGYALTGYTDSFGAGGTDCLFVKCDEIGHPEWNQTYGGHQGDHGSSVIQTPDGRYVMAGDTSSYGAGDYDFWLFVVNEFGTMLWNMTFGGAGPENAYSVTLTSDGGYIACGESKPPGPRPGDSIAVRVPPPEYTYDKKKIGRTLYGLHFDLDLETLNQHLVPSIWANNYCGPTAAAACLAWFAEANPQKYGRLIPDENGNGKIDEIEKYWTALVLGWSYMLTGPDGTRDSRFIGGLREYIDSHGLGDALTVTPIWWPSFNQLRDEFKKGEDVMVGIRDGDAFHWVVLRGIDDAYNVYHPTPGLSFMNPLTGTYTKSHIVPNFQGVRPLILSDDCGFDDNDTTKPIIDLIVSVSPTPRQDPPEFSTLCADSSTTSDDTLNGYVVVSDDATYVITGTDFGEVYVVDGTVFGVIGGTVYNTTGTVYGFANGTVSIVGGTYFPVTGSAYIINGSQATNMPSIPLHDVEVADVQPFKTVVGAGFGLSINVTVDNGGNQNETFFVTAYASATLHQRQTVTLTSGNSTTITFTWNTTGFAKGNYTIGAYAWPVPGETDKADNAFTGGIVHIGIPGDVNGDNYVGIDDIFTMGLGFGSEAGSTRWNAIYDINDDGYIGIDDIFTAASHFGEEE
jgi:hypothetical protein